MIVRCSALVAQSAADVFDVIEAAEHYPVFLPWCTGATIVSRDAASVCADLRVRVAAVEFTMRTRNPMRRPEQMNICLERGPFRRFDGQWRLRAITETGCRVDFTLDCEFDSAVMTRLAGPVFERSASELVEAFVRRAGAVQRPARGAAPRTD